MAVITRVIAGGSATVSSGSTASGVVIAEGSGVDAVGAVATVDGFVSGTHCKVSTRDGRFFLRDLDSTNGSYLRVKAEGILAQGDLILLGQQLFKIDLSH